MLCLSRKVGQQILIGDNITITITHIGGDKIRIGVDAPKDVLIVLKELEVEGEE